MNDDVPAPKVAWWARLLAIVFLAAAGVAAYGTVQEFIRHGSQEALPVVDLVLITYLSVLFGYVALTGRPPNRLFPIASLKLPFIRK